MVRKPVLSSPLQHLHLYTSNVLYIFSIVSVCVCAQPGKIHTNARKYIVRKFLKATIMADWKPTEAEPIKDEEFDKFRKEVKEDDGWTQAHTSEKCTVWTKKVDFTILISFHRLGVAIAVADEIFHSLTSLPSTLCESEPSSKTSPLRLCMIFSTIMPTGKFFSHLSTDTKFKIRKENIVLRYLIWKIIFRKVGEEFLNSHVVLS